MKTLFCLILLLVSGIVLLADGIDRAPDPTAHFIYPTAVIEIRSGPSTASIPVAESYSIQDSDPDTIRFLPGSTHSHKGYPKVSVAFAGLTRWGDVYVFEVDRDDGTDPLVIPFVFKGETVKVYESDGISILIHKSKG